MLHVNVLRKKRNHFENNSTRKIIERILLNIFTLIVQRRYQLGIFDPQQRWPLDPETQASEELASMLFRIEPRRRKPLSKISSTSISVALVNVCTNIHDTVPILVLQLNVNTRQEKDVEIINKVYWEFGRTFKRLFFINTENENFLHFLKIFLQYRAFLGSI